MKNLRGSRPDQPRLVSVSLSSRLEVTTLGPLREGTNQNSPIATVARDENIASRHILPCARCSVRPSSVGAQDPRRRPRACEVPRGQGLRGASPGPRTQLSRARDKCRCVLVTRTGSTQAAVSEEMGKRGSLGASPDATGTAPQEWVLRTSRHGFRFRQRCFVLSSPPSLALQDPPDEDP